MAMDGNHPERKESAVWTIELDVSADGDGTSDDLRSLLLAAYGELRKDSSVSAARMWATLSENQVTFKGIVADDEREAAMRGFSSAIRCALHAAGGHTPDWEVKTEQLIAALDRSRMVAEPIAA